MKYFRISLFSSGEIQWHPGGIYRTTCVLDVTYFPFDSQVHSAGCSGNSDYVSKL